MNYEPSSIPDRTPNPLLVCVPTPDHSADKTLPRFEPSELRERICAFVARKSGVCIEDVQPETRLLHDLGIDGDEAADLLVEFSVSLEIDMDGFVFNRFFHDQKSAFPLRFWSRRNRKLLPLTVDDLLRTALDRKFTQPQ